MFTTRLLIVVTIICTDLMIVAVMLPLQGFHVAQRGIGPALPDLPANLLLGLAELPIALHW